MTSNWTLQVSLRISFLLTGDISSEAMQDSQTSHYYWENVHLPSRVLGGQIHCQFPVFVGFLLFPFVKQHLLSNHNLQDKDLVAILQTNYNVRLPCS